VRDLSNDTGFFQSSEGLADGGGSAVGVDVGKFQAVADQTGCAEEEVLGEIGWNKGGVFGKVAPVGLQDGKLGASASRGICVFYVFAEGFGHAAGEKVVSEQGKGDGMGCGGQGLAGNEAGDGIREIGFSFCKKEFREIHGVQPEGFQAADRHGKFSGIHREFQQRASGNERNMGLEFMEVAKCGDGCGAFLNFIKEKQTARGDGKANEGELVEDRAWVGRGKGRFGCGMQFEIDFGKRDVFYARQFADEPCFSDLAGAVQQEGFTAFAVKPLLKRGEEMPFHILKIARGMFFSRHVYAFTAWRGRFAPRTDG